MNAGSEHTWTLPSDRSAVVKARGLVADACRDLPAQQVEVARLLVSELVTNALQHGSGEVTVAVVREGGVFRVEVRDGSRVMPVLLEGSSLMEHGFGLRLVAAFAGSWGVEPRADGRPGKQVWFALP